MAPSRFAVNLEAIGDELQWSGVDVGAAGLQPGREVLVDRLATPTRPLR